MEEIELMAGTALFINGTTVWLIEDTKVWGNKHELLNPKKYTGESSVNNPPAKGDNRE